MPKNDIPVAKSRSITSFGYNEYWLQEKIFDEPGILGLGDLVSVKREKRQKSGGRLDLLLKNPDDDSMFEVEVMLGDTDESHIIRTIEYWDFERRQYPQRQHYAVLIAEGITRRFFNVIQMLSASIPIIAIQATIFETGGGPVLAFTKVLDVYSEPEDETVEEGESVDEKWWQKRAEWILSAASSLLEENKDLLSSANLLYTKSYIAIQSSGRNLLWLKKRSSPSFRLGFRINEDKKEAIEKRLEEADISYVRRNNEYHITINIRSPRTTPDLIVERI
jgi:hypothetical protein